MSDTAEVIRCPAPSRERVLRAEIGWAIRMRWLFAGGCLAAAAGARWLPLAIDSRFFWSVGALLFLANGLYRLQLTRLERQGLTGRPLRRLCLWQVLVDFLSLGAIVYILGGVGTPVMFLVLPNAMFVALFFSRLESLAITLAGLAAIVLPLVLEMQGLVPIRSLADRPGSGMVAGGPPWSSGYLFFLVCCVLFCWYLVSRVSESLLRDERELAASMAAVRRLNEEKTGAVLRATHELKAPLAAIRSYAATLRDGYAGELPAKAQQAAGRMAVRCDELLAKITDIIRLSNLRSFVIDAERFGAVDLVEIVRQEVAEASVVGDRRGIAIEAHLPADGRSVRATEEMLRTVVANLLHNAVQYSRTGGTVTVAVETDDDRRPALIVRDEGIGIPETEQERIFEEHYRAANAVAHHDSGTGLGLAIVKATVELLGAELELTSRVDEGSTFTIRFPADAP